MVKDDILFSLLKHLCMLCVMFFSVYKDGLSGMSEEMLFRPLFDFCSALVAVWCLYSVIDEFKGLMGKLWDHTKIKKRDRAGLHSAFNGHFILWEQIWMHYFSVKRNNWTMKLEITITNSKCCFSVSLFISWTADSGHLNQTLLTD